jgi:hypothetical protein
MAASPSQDGLESILELLHERERKVGRLALLALTLSALALFLSLGPVLGIP